MAVLRQLAVVASSIMLGISAQASDLAAKPEVAAFIDKMVKQHQFEKESLYRLFDQVVEKPRVLEILDRPGTAQPWYKYQPNFVNSTRIARGVAYYKQNRATLEAASAKYGVPAEIIVAILGVETDYGRNAGSFRLVDVLSTIGFDYPRRAEYFQGELEAFLLLARAEGGDPLAYKGSYAGAMGLPQFMPSTFNKYAVDGDGDGHKDIWNNQTDAIYSIANYLQSYGWQKGGDLTVQAMVSGESYPTLVAERFNLNWTIAEMAKFGVKPMGEVNLQDKAILFPLETSPGVVEHWLGLPNFFVITRYNKSTLYAMSVVRLANAIAAGAA